MKNKIKNIIIIILICMFIFSRFRPVIEMGYCINNYGDGIILNSETLQPIDVNYNYVKYDKNLSGKCIFTLYIFNPLNNYPDDIIIRYDFISNKNIKPDGFIEYIHCYNY